MTGNVVLRPTNSPNSSTAKILTNGTQLAESARRPSLQPSVQICSRCIYDSHVPGISFDANGMCSYCRQHDELDREYPIGPAGDIILHNLVKQMKAAGKGKPFDVVVGVSGGCDSSLTISKAVELGLRPLAAHYDNTWNSTIAVENIHRVLTKLNVELFTIVVDNEEYNDILRAFMLAGVPDLEAATDIGMASTMYIAAAKYKIPYVWVGHSFRTEGISPLGWLYMDGKYIQSVHRKFGTRRMNTFPNLWLYRFLKWTLVDQIQNIRPLYWMDYQKEPTKKMLVERFNWQWYGGHHLENRLTTFYHSYFLPRRFGIDQRANGFAALARAGQMTRAEALANMAEPPTIDPELVTLFRQRLGFTEAEFEHLMTDLPKKCFLDFKTYKKTFERLRPLWWLAYKRNLIPKSFYMKFARPMGQQTNSMPTSLKRQASP